MEVVFVVNIAAMEGLLCYDPVTSLAVDLFVSIQSQRNKEVVVVEMLITLSLFPPLYSALLISVHVHVHIHAASHISFDTRLHYLFI